MMARKAISVTDDRGMLEITLGADPMPWTLMEDLLRLGVGSDDTVQVSYETLMGWGRWTYGILLNDQCVCFVNGDDPPVTVLGKPVGYPDEPEGNA